MKLIFKLFFLIIFLTSCDNNFEQQVPIEHIDTNLYNYKSPIDTTSQHILLIGDSMTGVFRWPLRDYCQYNGHKLSVVIWDAANTIWYNIDDTFAYYVNKVKPTYIFVLLGSNELFVPDINKREKYIRGILRQIGDIPFIWIGPPNWKKDTGINDLLLRIVGKDRFFPTYKISMNNPHFTRYPDGAHPRLKAAKIWMDSLAVWIMTKSSYPICMYKPKHRGNMKFKLYYMAPMVHDTVKKDSINFLMKNDTL